MAKRKPVQILSLTDAEKKKITEEIKAFYLDVRGEEIGMIEEQQIMDFFLETLGSVIYNKALDDAFRWHKQVSENMESDYYGLYKNI